MMRHAFYIGFDPREAAAFAVAKYSLNRHLITPVPVRGLVLSELRAKGLYTRPTSVREGRLWDDISGAAMSTEFACSRFLVRQLAKTGWAIFMDCDVLIRSNMERLFKVLDPTKAVMVVKHNFQPPACLKMDHQIQSQYSRKLWSAFMAINCDHSANQALTLELVNTAPGRDLHRFGWLEDKDIGELDMSWNWVPGVSDPDIEPDCVHWSEGGPWFQEYTDVPYADEWRQALHNWASGPR